MSAALLLGLLLFAFAVIQAAVINGWRGRLTATGVSEPAEAHDMPGVSVIIPMRDEAERIALLLQDLHAQRYARDRVEVLVVDDGSSDRSAAIVEGMQRSWPALRLLKNHGVGKKAAIGMGVQQAQHDLVLLTDADTRCGPERLVCIAKAMEVEQLDLLIAPVWTEGSGLLGALQEEEQAALLGVAIGSARAGAPVLAYGANLAFSKAAFLAVGGFSNDHYTSGDDHFLLHRMRANGRSIGALFSPDAAVVTDAETGWRGFVQQRLRWAGKMRGAFSMSSALALVALLWPWLLVTATAQFSLTGSIGHLAWYRALLLIGAWALWIMPLLGLARDVRRGMGRPGSSVRTLLALYCFSVYAPVIAVLSQMLRPRWKGRPVNRLRRAGRPLPHP